MLQWKPSKHMQQLQMSVGKTELLQSLQEPIYSYKTWDDPQDEPVLAGWAWQPGLSGLCLAGRGWPWPLLLFSSLTAATSQTRCVILASSLSVLGPRPPSKGRAMSSFWAAMRGPLSLKEREDATLTNAHAGHPIGLYSACTIECPYLAWNMAKGTVPSCRRLAAPASDHCVSGSVDNHNSTNSIYQAINGYSMPFNSTQFNIIQYYS